MTGNGNQWSVLYAQAQAIILDCKVRNNDIYVESIDWVEVFKYLKVNMFPRLPNL